MSEIVGTSQTAAEVRRLVTLWAPRLGIAERIAVEVFPGDDPEARCSMKPARMIPEAQGLWDFVLEWSESVDLDDYQHTVVHELTHLLLEPLRERYFNFTKALVDQHLSGWVLRDDFAKWSNTDLDERWETVVQRVADAFERAYDQGSGRVPV